jgi:hypothetical protein
VNLGFTGSRHEPTRQQKNWLLEYLLDNPQDEFHHGCCVGSDEFSHKAAKSCLDMGLKQIVLHPPVDTSREMKYTDWDYANCVWYPRKEFLARDRDVVKATTRLIALPNGPERMRGSGTWYTVRYALEHNRPVLICNPLGHVTERMP